MVLHETYGEINMQNCGCSAKNIKLRWWRLLLHVPSYSKRWHVADVKNIIGNDQATLTVDQNSANTSHTFPFHIYLRLQDREWCSAADDNSSCYELAPSFFEEMTRCQRQKHRRRWPGNPNSKSKFRKYRAFLPILRLRDCDWCSVADGSFWRSLKQHLADVKNITGDDQGSIEILQLPKFMLTRSSKTIWKSSFCCSNTTIMMPLHTVFSFYHLQRLLFSPTKNNFSTTLNPIEKPRHIEELFVDSIYAKTIDIIKLKKFYF